MTAPLPPVLQRINVLPRGHPHHHLLLLGLEGERNGLIESVKGELDIQITIKFMGQSSVYISATQLEGAFL